MSNYDLILILIAIENKVPSNLDFSEITEKLSKIKARKMLVI